MNPLSRIRIREAVGVDFSSNNLKIAHMKISPGKRELVSVLNRNISGLADSDISRILRSSFGELKAKNPAVIGIVPSHMVITKNIEIPSANPQEIKEIINLQGSRYTPYSREEITVDYIDIGTYKQNYTKILLVIVARSVVKRQFEVLERAGIKLEKVVLASESLARSVPKLLKLESEASPVNIVHIDQDFSDFIIVFRNKPVFIRSIPIGTQYLLAEREKYQLKFIEELKKSLEAYQSEDIEKTPNMLVLTGAVEELKNLEAMLKDTSHLPIRVIPSFGNLAISDGALKASSLTGQLSFLNVIASLLTSEEVKVNLIPEEIKLRKSLEERGKDLIKTGILILTFFVLFFSLSISKIYFKNAYLNNINKKYQALNQEAQKLENDFVKVDLVRNYLSNRGYSLEVLTELYDVAPLDLELNDIQFDRQGKFSVKGTAASMSTVFSFVDNMEKSKHFKDVRTRYTAKRKDGIRDVTDFEIKCLLSKNPVD